jgi:hypothetical protein
MRCISWSIDDQPTAPNTPIHIAFWVSSKKHKEMEQAKAPPSPGQTTDINNHTTSYTHTRKGKTNPILLTHSIVRVRIINYMINRPWIYRPCDTFSLVWKSPTYMIQWKWTLDSCDNSSILSEDPLLLATTDLTESDPTGPGLTESDSAGSDTLQNQFLCGLLPQGIRFCGVWRPADASSLKLQRKSLSTPRNLIPRSLIPRSPIPCRIRSHVVWYPAELGPVGSDILLNRIQQGLRLYGIRKWPLSCNVSSTLLLHPTRSNLEGRVETKILFFRGL